MSLAGSLALLLIVLSNIWQSERRARRHKAFGLKLLREATECERAAAIITATSYRAGFESGRADVLRRWSMAID